MAGKSIPLSEVAHVLGGYAFKSSDLGKTGFPVIKIANIEPPRVNTQNCERIPPEIVSGLEKYRLNKRDILMAMTGATIGKAGRLQSPEVAYLNQRVAKIYAKNGVEFDDFIFAIVSQQGFDSFVLNNSNGSAQANVSTEGIGRILIPDLTPRQQIAIGQFIAALDDKIELNRKMNETLEAMARAIFKSWFVDFDPVVAKSEGRQPEGMDAETAILFPDSFEESEIGRIPKGWKPETFGTVASCRRAIVSAADLPPDLSYFGLEHMPRRSIALSEWGVASSVESAKSRFNKGDVLFGKLRPYFHKVGIAPVDGICSTDILVIVPKKTEWSSFVLGHASSDEMIEFANGCSTGTRMPRVGWGDLARYPIPLPPESLAGKLTALLEPFYKSINANIQANRLLTSIRDALLPRLLSGELAVATD